MSLAAPRLNRLPAAERGITIGDFLVPVSVGERISVRARHIALIVAGALLIALSAKIRFLIPGDPVPVTGQTFGVLLVGGALGAKRGTAATLLYLLLGLWFPVYASDHYGAAQVFAFTDRGIVLGATGGYLIGFVLAGGLVGRLAELGWDRGLVGALAAMLVGNLAIYLVGLPWLMAAAGMDPATAIAQGLTPFIAGDALKLLLAAGIFPIAWWVVDRRPDER